jgi:hypothetical protein
MSYDTWDKAIDAASNAGAELGRTIAAWQDVPEGDALQLCLEASDAYHRAAVDAFRKALAAEAHGPECEDGEDPSPLLADGDSTAEERQ